MTDARAGYEPWLPALLTVTRVVVGAGTVALAVAFLPFSVDVGVAVDVPFLIFGAVCLLGGAALLALPRLRPRVGPVEWLAGAVVAAGGLVAAALIPVRQSCCDAAHVYSRGLPLPWTTHGADTREQAVGTAWAAPAGVDTLSVMCDVVFWAYAGLLVLVSVGVIRRALRDRVGARP